MVPALRRVIALVALSVGIAVAAGAAPAAAATTHNIHSVSHPALHSTVRSTPVHMQPEDWWF